MNLAQRKYSRAQKASGWWQKGLVKIWWRSSLSPKASMPYELTEIKRTLHPSWQDSELFGNLGSENQNIVNIATIEPDSIDSLSLLTVTNRKHPLKKALDPPSSQGCLDVHSSEAADLILEWHGKVSQSRRETSLVLIEAGWVYRRPSQRRKVHSLMEQQKLLAGQTGLSLHKTSQAKAKQHLCFPPLSSILSSYSIGSFPLPSPSDGYISSVDAMVQRIASH